MGNKIHHGGLLARAVPAPKAPEPVPQLPQCTDPHCTIKQSHDDTTYIVGQPNLPHLVQAKHTALDGALANKRYGQARSAHEWLMNFYTLHGLGVKIAMNGLPALPPPPPKRCRDPECPVTQFHEGPLCFHKALEYGNYAHALTVHDFMEQFWKIHGPADGSAIAEMPAMPVPCANAKCTVKEETHEDKQYVRWAKDKSFPTVVKKHEWKVTEVYNRWDLAWEAMKEMELLDGFFGVHGEKE